MTKEGYFEWGILEDKSEESKGMSHEYKHEDKPVREQVPRPEVGASFEFLRKRKFNMAG